MLARDAAVVIGPVKVVVGVGLRGRDFKGVGTQLVSDRLRHSLGVPLRRVVGNQDVAPCRRVVRRGARGAVLCAGGAPGGCGIIFGAASGQKDGERCDGGGSHEEAASGKGSCGVHVLLRSMLVR